MKVLVINGSPKGNKSNSYQLTKAFLQGMELGLEEVGNGEKAEIEQMDVNRLDIRPCLGCFSCWEKTPGKCCIQDDMQEVIEKMIWADITVWSFPLYYFSVPGGLKNLIDRQLPMVLPFMVEREDQVGNGSHAARYDMSGKRNIVISTCGFYTAEGNYDGVCSLFDHMCGKDQYTTLFCGQGELFRVPELSDRTGKYLEFVKSAGREYVNGGISEATRAELERLLYPKETFEAMADASWDIDKESGEKQTEALIFTKQMAALYRKAAYPGEDQVLEMYYTDLDECYQILLGKEGSKVFTDGSLTATTRIETPFTVWHSIAIGEIRGDEALMKKMYKVKGDFNLMLKWDTYFGGSETNTKNKADSSDTKGQDNCTGIHIPPKETNMNIMLLPWIVLWVAAAINGHVGSLISISVCALTPLVFYRNKKTVYDLISGALVTGFAIGILSGAPERIIVPLSYLAFGIMWTITCFGKIPLTAHYSMNGYDGESALQNPLFMKTNWILTLMWGILYLLTPIWTYFIMGTSISSLVGAINSILPIFMGIFTVWFQKWYPAKVASGE
ncbi:MAG: NAD(P)H-dependent oxidoreductase [Roseburia sp.]|nr:NAD(P)H-dependent oxidoreductase [Roseburia sp.]MCM1279537.1 NAD(P)H-dependent oxidoreductase [Robinsoniella sp.]